MAIDYTNIIYDRVLSNMRKTIGGELSIPVYMDSHKGSSSIVINPLSDNLVETFASGQQREVALSIVYEINLGGEINVKNFKQVSNIAEHIKRLFAPDNNAKDGTDYFGGQVQSIEYEKDEEDNKIRAIITLTVQTFEAV
tara:strand:+ start:3140 stop:3559 length:420 start_codon:yes stop_codon:yes gene_type:complete